MAMTVLRAMDTASETMNPAYANRKSLRLNQRITGSSIPQERLRCSRTYREVIYFASPTYPVPKDPGSILLAQWDTRLLVGYSCPAYPRNDRAKVETSTIGKGFHFPALMKVSSLRSSKFLGNVKDTRCLRRGCAICP